jgi:hypothetical protein
MKSGSSGFNKIEKTLFLLKEIWQSGIFPPRERINQRSTDRTLIHGS